MQASRGNSAVNKASTSRETDGKWSEDDQQILIKLGNFIIHFIRVPIFCNSETMTTYVIKPLLDDGGPKPGSIRVLDQLIEMVMIRHK